MSDDTNPSVNDKGERGRGCAWELIWPIMFFGIGASMLLWPNAIIASSGACDPGVYGGETLDCFIGTAWGKPDAIALCFIITFLMLLSALHRSMRAHDS